MTTRALKLKRRPPLTTAAQRRIDTTLSDHSPRSRSRLSLDTVIPSVGSRQWAVGSKKIAGDWGREDDRLAPQLPTAHCLLPTLSLRIAAPPRGRRRPGPG